MIIIDLTVVAYSIWRNETHARYLVNIFNQLPRDHTIQTQARF